MRKKVAAVVLLVIAGACGTVHCEERVNTTRKDLLVASDVSDTVDCFVDTAKGVQAFADDAVKMIAYSKKKSDARESFMLVNNTSHHISHVEITFRYTDVNGAQLHERTEMVECDLPPYSTRQASVKSWDKGNRFYYYKDKSRKGAIPYKVMIKVQIYDVRVKR